MKTYYKHHSPHSKFSILYSIFHIPHSILKILKWLFHIPHSILHILLPHRLMRRLSSTQRMFVNMVVVATLLVIGIWIYTSFINPEQTEASWFNQNWLYRQAGSVTNSSGSTLSNFQIVLTVDTATLISAGKMQSNCDDIRVTDQKGKILPHWIETGGKGCNTSTTNIWVKYPSLTTSGGTVFLYYGNAGATSNASGDRVFEFFDDFSGSSLNTAKWTQGTIGATSGTNFAVASSELTGGNTNRYLLSSRTFTGDYIAESRTYTTTGATNGYTVIGFWASTANGFAILDHNGTSYYRNDSGWPSIAFNGNTQWTRNTVKLVGTAGTYARVGETSGSISGSATNSGLSSEYLRLSSRSDNSANNQNYVASWDWIIVRKAVTTEPSVSFGDEEQSEGPVAYWKFDEGQGTKANDSANNKYGTISGATWKSESECVSGNCLYFDGSADNVAISSSIALPNQFTFSHWIRTGATGGQIYTIGNAGSSNGYRFGISSGKVQFLIGNGPALTEQPCGTKTVNDNKWHLITGVFDASGTFDCYIDGAHEAQVTFASRTGFSTSAPGIGAPPCCTDFQGYIDDVKIYPYSRSATQIRSDYNSRGSVKGTSVAAGSANTSSLSNGLVGYWKMDESSWTVDCSTLSILDASGNNANARSCPNSTGPTAATTGKFGNGANLDGSDDRILINYSSALALPTDFSFSVWLYNRKATGTTDPKTILYHETYQTNGLRFNINTNNTLSLFTTLSGGSLSVTTSTALSQNKWYFLTITYSSKDSTGTIYIDGQKAASGTGTYVPNTSSVYELGDASGDSRYNLDGILDEARLYNRALSSSEVSQLYNFAPSPIAYYDFEERGGSTLYDKSGTGNNSTSMGGTPTWTQGVYGGGLQFDNASTDQVTIPASSSLYYNDYTLGFWIKFDNNYDAGYKQILTRDPNGTDRAPGLWRAPSALRVHWKQQSGNAGPNSVGPEGENTSFVAGKWYYLSGVKNGTSFDLYIDGIKIGSTYTITDPITNDTGGYFYIGRTPTYTSAGFTIDDLRLYNYARTPKQVISDMNAGHPAGGSPIGSQVVYLKMDEGYGTTANNSGNTPSLTGSINGPVWSNDGKNGKALSFDGTDDYVQLTDNAALNLTSEWTIGGWFRPDETVLSGSDRQVLISKWQTSSGTLINYYLYINTSGKAVGVVGDGSTGQSVISTTTLSPNRWYHLMATFNGSTGDLKVYVNGKLEATTATGYAAAYANTGNVRLGQYDFAWASYRDEYKGLMDDIKIYGSALTAEQVKIDMTQNASLVLGAGSTSSDGTTASNSASRLYCIPGDTSTCSPPVAEWKFDEKTGTTANDTSGNGATGTLNSSTTWTTGKVGAGVRLNGTSSNISLGTNTINPLINGASAVTISAWAKINSYPGSSARERIFSVYNNSTSTTGLALSLYNAGNVEVGGRSVSTDGFQNTTYTAPSLNEWHLLTGVLDFANDKIYIYIDGSLKTTATVTFNNTSYTQGTSSVIDSLGSSTGGGEFFDGIIDDVRLYNYARTAAQIAWDYNRGGPVARWKMDECQGSTLHDASGNGLDGTITIGASGTQTSVGTCQTASTAWGNGATGKFNSALNFDGTDDYFSASQPNIPTSPNAFTITGYIKPTTQDGLLVTPNSNGIDQYVWYDVDLQRLAVNVATSGDTNVGTYYSRSNAVPTSTWTHFAVSINNRDVKIYINGKLNASNTHGFDIGGWTSTWYLGQRGNSTFWYSGQMDDFHVFPYVLTETQIKNVMNQGGAVRFGPATGTP